MRVINRLEVLWLGGCGISLTPGHLALLFSDMARNTNVKFLAVGGDFSEIIPEVFGAAISNVKDVRLFGVDYTTSHQHMKALFSAIMVGDKQLKRLTVRVAMDTAHSIDPAQFSLCTSVMVFSISSSSMSAGGWSQQPGQKALQAEEEYLT